MLRHQLDFFEAFYWETVWTDDFLSCAFARLCRLYSGGGGSDANDNDIEVLLGMLGFWVAYRQ